MEVYVQGTDGLIPLQEEVTAESIQEALGYTPADEKDLVTEAERASWNDKVDNDDLESHKTDTSHITDVERETWNNKPDLESIDESDDSTLYISDKDGNIIAKIDKDGLHTTEVYIGDESGEQSVAEMITKAVAGLDVDFEETDPTVSDWAKQPTKPTYTAEEVGALPNTTPIPDVSGKLETSTFENHEADLDKHLGGDISTKNDEALYICDKDGNIIAQFDGNGANVSQLQIGHIPITDYLSDAIENGGTPCNHEYATIQELPRGDDCTTWRDLQYCSSCGKVHANLIHTEHAFGDLTIVTQPLCDRDGDAKHTCTRCNKTEMMVITAFGHDWDTEVVITPPTCTEQGYTSRVCNNCGEDEKFNFQPPTGHTEGEWIVDIKPTTTLAGSRHKECTVCGERLTTELIPVLGAGSDGTFDYVPSGNGTYAVESATTSLSGEITIPSEYNGVAVTEIINQGFYNCRGITKVIIPDSITYIGDGAFSGCEELETVIIGNGVTYIGIEAFHHDDNLTHAYYEGTQSEWNSVEADSNTNNPLINTLYYYSENAPTTTGNYWRYVDGEPKVWGVDIYGFEIDTGPGNHVLKIGTYTNYITPDETKTIVITPTIGYILSALVSNAEYTFTKELGYQLTVFNPTGNVTANINGIAEL